MDETRFDRLAQLVGGTSSRRHQLRAAAALLAAVGLGTLATVGEAAELTPEGVKKCRKRCKRQHKHNPALRRCKKRCKNSGAKCTVCKTGGCTYTTITTALYYANNGDLGTSPTITIGSGSYQETGLEIKRGMTIKACDDNAAVVIDAAQSSTAPIFTIKSSDTNPVTIEGGATNRLQLKNSRAESGGLKMDGSNLSNTTLKNVDISGIVSPGRGAIWQASGTTLTLENCDIHGNSATTIGGGVYAQSGPLTLVGYNRIQNNSATLGGGGVFVDTGGTLTMDTTADQQITGNTSAKGGGVASDGTLTSVTCAQVTGNTATTSCNNVLTAYGGAQNCTCA